MKIGDRGFFPTYPLLTPGGKTLQGEQGVKGGSKATGTVNLS